jgi:hypothetical protein
MPSVVAFSGREGDSIRVAEDVQKVLDQLGSRVGGLCQLTQVDAPGTEPRSVYVNPGRVAYVIEG